MTTDDMRRAVGESVQRGGVQVRLVAPQFPKYAGFPRGELLCINADGDQVRLFEPWRIVKWLDELPEEAPR